jgi:predicted alpha/beta hydrolase family esterase
MKQTILIHGVRFKDEFYNPETPSLSNSHWIPWIQKQLSLKDELAQGLEFPRSYDPIYEDWVKTLEQLEINEQTILVGHSAGGGFLLRYLSEHPDIKVAKVVLIAPWLDPSKELSTNFFNFSFDENLANRFPLHIFVSSDDFDDIQTSFSLIKSKLAKAIYHEFTDKEHFCFTEFPELLELL